MQKIVAQLKNHVDLTGSPCSVLSAKKKRSIIVNLCRTDTHLKSEQAENKGFAYVKTWGSGVDL